MTLALTTVLAVRPSPAAPASSSGPGQPVFPPGSDAPVPSVPEPTGTIDLRDALACALRGSPELASFAWRVRAAEADVLQAGRPPNPELGLRAEDIGVSGPVSGFQQAELTVELGQLIELGGKRAARIERASRERELAAWDYEVARVDVLARTAQTFVAVVVAQEQSALAVENERLAHAVVDAVSTRVRAGSTSTAELTKAEVALATSRIELDAARRALDTARRRLAASWGATGARFVEARGDLEPTRAIASLAELEERLDESPDLARWSTELLQRQAVIDLERAQAVPDVTARGGYRRLFDPDENTFVVGLSVPLPVFDRNDGAIVAAEGRLAEARAEREAARVRLATALADAYQDATTASTQAATLAADVLPGAREAFERLNAGYREGRFSYLDVLDAQRTLIAARAQRVRALGDHHRAVVALERLLGETPSPGDANAARREKE